MSKIPILKPDQSYTFRSYFEMSFDQGEKRFDQGDYGGAMTGYNKAIALNPQFATAYNNRGLLKQEKLNDPNGALADYNKAIALNPNYATAYNNRGDLKANKLNDRPGAIKDFRAAAKISRQQGNVSYLKYAINQLQESDFSRDLENLSLNLSPTRRETLNIPPSRVGKGVRGLGG